MHQSFWFWPISSCEFCDTILITPRLAQVRHYIWGIADSKVTWFHHRISVFWIFILYIFVSQTMSQTLSQTMSQTIKKCRLMNIFRFIFNYMFTILFLQFLCARRWYLIKDNWWEWGRLHTALIFFFMHQSSGKSIFTWKLFISPKEITRCRLIIWCHQKICFIQ